GRRSRFIEARGLDAHAFLEIKRAVIGKAVAWLATVCIDGDHPSIIDRQEDTTRTIGRGGLTARIDGPLRRFMIGHATARQMLERSVGTQIGVKGPAQLSTLGVQREEPLMLRA